MEEKAEGQEKMGRIARKFFPKALQQKWVNEAEREKELERKRAWAATVTPEMVHQWIIEDTEKLRIKKEEEKKEQARTYLIKWCTQPLEQCRCDLGLTEDLHYSEDRKTVYLELRNVPASSDPVYVTLDAVDVERVAIKRWTFRTFPDGSSRIVCLGDLPQVSLSRFITGFDKHHRQVQHLNGNKLDFRRSNLYPFVAVPLPNEWGNYRHTALRGYKPPPRSKETEERYIDSEIPRRSYARFYGQKWLIEKRIAMEAAHGKCQNCRRKKAVHVHHILPIRYFKEPDDAHFQGNLCPVCLLCHQELHRTMKDRFPLFECLQYDFGN
jgi:hypothetical protein